MGEMVHQQHEGCSQTSGRPQCPGCAGLAPYHPRLSWLCCLVVRIHWGQPFTIWLSETFSQHLQNRNQEGGQSFMHFCPE